MIQPYTVVSVEMIGDNPITRYSDLVFGDGTRGTSIKPAPRISLLEGTELYYVVITTIHIVTSFSVGRYCLPASVVHLLSMRIDHNPCEQPA